MNHADTLNRILSHMTPTRTNGRTRTYQIPCDSLTVTIDAYPYHEVRDERGEYIHSEYHITDFRTVRQGA